MNEFDILLVGIGINFVSAIWTDVIHRKWAFEELRPVDEIGHSL